MPNQSNDILINSRLIDIWHKEEKESCESSYESFVRSAWHVLEPDTDIQWNWHMSYICEVLQKEMERVAKKQKREYHIVCNVPPSSAKSMIFTRMANAWAWIKWPWMRFLTSSYAGDLSLEHSGDTRTIIGSEWYQKNWGENYFVSPKQDAKSFFLNSYGGRRQTTSTGSKVTGRHAHIIIIDDPVNPEQTESEVELPKSIRYYKRTLRSRLIIPEVAMFWVVMQRLHEEDLTGYILHNEKEKYLHICLPAENRDWVNPPHLREKYVNGLLFEQRFSQDMLDEMAKSDPYTHAGQYLQLPSPEEGGIFKRQNWRFWLPRGVHLPDYKVRVGIEEVSCPSVELPTSFDDVINSWDFTFKEKEVNDYVSGHPIGSAGANFYFLGEYHKKTDFAGSCSAMTTMREQYPLSSETIIEDKANGSAIISEFRDIITGITAVPSHGTENTRIKANVVSKAQSTGNVILPHPHLPGMGWVKDFIDEYAAYPNAKHDDRVSSGCQGICHLKSSKPVFPMFQIRRANISIDWLTLKDHMIPYISQWVEKDMRTSIIVALWDSLLARMAIIDEFDVNTAQPEVVAFALKEKIKRRTKGVVTDLKRFEWIGNALMFSRNDRTGSKSNLVREGMWDQYERVGVSINDNLQYDEHGSILILGKMFSLKTIVIDQKAPETSRQLAAWNYEGNEPAKYGYGFARALCNLVSIINETGSVIKTRKRLKRYSPAKDSTQQLVDKLDQEDRLDDFIKQDMGLTITESNHSVSSENSWMIGG